MVNGHRGGRLNDLRADRYGTPPVLRCAVPIVPSAMIGAAVFGENAAQDAASETASYEVHLGFAALRVASPRRLGRRTSAHAVADVASKERRGSAAAAPARAGEFLTGRTPTARARASAATRTSGRPLQRRSGRHPGRAPAHVGPVRPSGRRRPRRLDPGTAGDRLSRSPSRRMLYPPESFRRVCASWEEAL